MTPNIKIVVDDKQLRETLAKLEKAVLDLTPVFRKITGTLAYETERNFAEQGRPKWPSLSQSTKDARIGRMGAKGEAKKRKGEGIRLMILQDDGQLAASVTTDYDRSMAVIGSNKDYARIHQLGGQAGRGRKVTIPARPYLPVTEDGELSPEASKAVLDTVLRHLQTVVN